MSIERNKVYRQKYRVADSSYARYELYVGEDAMPDFDGSGQPVATSQTLPFTYTPSAPGAGLTKELYCVVRERSQFNLLSCNQQPTILTIDENGDEELGPLSDPELLRVIDGEESGKVIVFGRYPRDVDQNEADTWDVYAEIDTDPDPDVHTAKGTFDFTRPGVEHRLFGEITGLTPGSTYHFLVVVRRDEESGDGEIGESDVVQHTVATVFDIDGGEVDAF